MDTCRLGKLGYSWIITNKWLLVFLIQDYRVYPEAFPPRWHVTLSLKLTRAQSSSSINRKKLHWLHQYRAVNTAWPVSECSEGRSTEIITTRLWPGAPNKTISEKLEQVGKVRPWTPGYVGKHKAVITYTLYDRTYTLPDSDINKKPW